MSMAKIQADQTEAIRARVRALMAKKALAPQDEREQFARKVENDLYQEEEARNRRHANRS